MSESEIDRLLVLNRERVRRHRLRGKDKQSQAREQRHANTLALIAPVHVALSPPSPAPFPSDNFYGSVYIDPQHVHDEAKAEGRDYDWIAVKGMRGDPHNIRTIKFLLQWMDMRTDGTPWPDEWVKAQRCRLPIVWDWLMREVVHQSTVSDEWLPWVGVIEKRWRQSLARTEGGRR